MTLYCSLRYSEELLREPESARGQTGADNFMSRMWVRVAYFSQRLYSIFFYKARTLVYFNLHTLFALHFLL